MKYLYLDTVIKERGFSRKEVAKAIGLSYNALSKRITGYVEFDLGELRAIAKYLGLTHDEFGFIFLK